MSRTRARLERLERLRPAADQIVIFHDWGGAFLTAWRLAADGCHILTQAEADAWLADHPTPETRTLRLSWGDALA